jgi:NhaA family Na+:H+ antiporter
MPISAIRQFVKWEGAGGIALMGAAAFALFAANSALAPFYDRFLDLPVSIEIGSYGLSKPILIWINDLLMAVFFLLVGLEIKREVVEGELSSVKQAGLPALAALAGMAVPAAIYVAINSADALALRGWAIASATDIAFALGVLSLAGRRVPASLKVLLMAIAILDDLGAIVIIAAFYTADLSWWALGFAGVAIAGLAVLNAVGVRKIAPYVLIGAALWLSVLESGVHATLAGVVLALFIPLREKDGKSPLRRMEHALHPWVAFAIVPLFGFANAGLSFTGMTLDSLWQPIPLGIAAGLFLGKQAGILLAIAVAVALGLAARPAQANWLQIYGMSVICGIGFTMSLFIGTLAFEEPSFATPIRLGVLLGSILSAVLGLIVFRLSPGARR